MNYQLFGKNVRKHRLQLGMRQEDLAEKVNCSPSHIGQIEHARGIPSLEVAVNIANALHITVDQLVLDSLDCSGIIFTFPKVMGGKAKSRLVLKTPKTESSILTVWIPRTLALILREWQEKQRSLKELMGEDFIDYNLVLALETGRPCEERVIGNAFNRLKQKTGLPNVVFHSLRHSSTTYKLKVNHGDIKATQGDTGHAQPDMVTEVYAHILDEDRKINAQRFELAFYANPDLRKTEEDIRKSRPSAQSIDLGSLITQLREQPELAATLVQLLKGVAPQETNTGFRIAY